LRHDAARSTPLLRVRVRVRVSVRVRVRVKVRVRALLGRAPRYHKLCALIVVLFCILRECFVLTAYCFRPFLCFPMSHARERRAAAAKG
jgi:hypothetical protein